MTTALLLVLMAIDGAGDAGAEAIVGRLVAPRAAERAEAERALLRLGDDVLPALAKAAGTADLELRAKVAALRDAIEAARLTRPTLVALDLIDVSPRQAASAIGEKAGVVILIEPEGGGPMARPPGDRPATRPFSLREPGPIPLWAALDRWAEQSGLRLDPAMNSAIMQRMPPIADARGRRRVLTGRELVYRRKDDSPEAPASDFGPLRTTIVGLRLDRKRDFSRNVDAPNLPEASATFTVTLSTRAEPKLSLVAADEARLDEAIDDRGQSLLSPIQAPPPPANPYLLNPSAREQGGTAPIVLALRPPEDPGVTIARLSGTYRAMVVGRTGESVAIPLAASIGKTFAVGTSSLTIHKFAPLPGGRDALFEYTATDGPAPGQAPQYFNPNDPRAGLRPPPEARGQVEFLDAQGRTCHWLNLGAPRDGMNGFNPSGRMTVSVSPSGEAGPAVEARYHAATWSRIAVPFRFLDVPMP